MQPNTHTPSIIKVGLALLLLSFTCIGTLLFGADQVCHANIEQWIPLYPEATIVSAEHNWIRARAMGSTTVMLSTEDDAETARQFYRDVTIALMRAEQSRGLASTGWNVVPNPNGDGSLITLYSSCGE